MSQWGSNDNAANSPFYAATSVKLTPTDTTRTELFENNTEDQFIQGARVGVYGVDVGEQAIVAKKATHAGWTLRTEGSGGRAGRVFYETLVAMGSMAEDDGNNPYQVSVLGDSEVYSVDSTIFTVDRN